MCRPPMTKQAEPERLEQRSLDLDPRNWIKHTLYHYRAGNINWPMGLYITLVHYWATWGLRRLHVVSSQTLLWAFILWPISGLGITAGVHRLWSHRSYDAKLPLRIVLMLFNSIANQGAPPHAARRAPHARCGPAGGRAARALLARARPAAPTPFFASRL